MRFICIVLFVLFYAGSAAQSGISGSVTDSSAEAVAFATVSLQGAGQQQINTLTDTTGHFSFTNLQHGHYLLTVSPVGFAGYSLQLFLQKDTVLKIILHRSGTQLSEVVVTGSKPLIERLSDKIVFNVANSVTATGTDALQAVSLLPGVTINNNELGVVGKGLTKVMINNRLILLAGEDLTRYLKSMSANEIARIELITNPSAKYDAEGNAGLINILTKHDKRQGYSGNLQLSAKRTAPGQSEVYGIRNIGDVNGSGNINYNRGKWSAFANVNYAFGRLLEGFKTDIYYPTQTWRQTDTGLYKNRNFNMIAGVDYKISSGTTIGASYLGGKNIYDGSDHVNNPIYNNGSGKIDSTLKTYATYYPVALTNSVNVHADIKLDTMGSLLFLNADYFNYHRTDISDFESNSYDSDGKYKPEGNTRYFDRNKQLINVYTLKADADLPTSFAKYAVGAKLSFITNYSNAFYYKKLNGGGLEYDTNLSNEFDYRENTQAVYGSMIKTISKWKLQGGLRGELTQTKGYSYTLNQTTNRNYFKLYPSLLVNFQADPDNEYSLSVGRRINRPSFWNLNPFKSLFTAYSYGEGNPYLQPENNSNFEISHAYKSIITSAVFFNITQNGFNNVTLASPDTNLVYTIPLNFIKTFRAGISENISLRISNWWESNQQLTFYHTTSNSSLVNISDIRGFGAYLSSNNTFYLNDKKTFAGAVNAWYQFPEINHIGRSDRYYKLDIGLKVSMNNQWDIALNLNDAFRSSASAVSSTINGIQQKFTSFQVNRYLQLSVAYRFGNSSSAAKRSSGNDEERERVP